MVSFQQIRKERGLSCKQVAERSGLSISTINNIEYGYVSKINVATAQAIANVFGLETYEMFNSTEISELGRPPYSGNKYTHSLKRNEIKCQNCWMVVPRRDVCTECEQPITSA